MTTHRHQPRSHSIRLYHSSLEIQKLLNTMKDTAELIRLIQFLPTLSSTTKKQLTLLLLLNMASTVVLTHIPRTSDDTALPRRDSTHFQEIQFKEHFRFRRKDFYRVMSALNLTDLWHSECRTIRLGHDGAPQATICSLSVPVCVFITNIGVSIHTTIHTLNSNTHA